MTRFDLPRQLIYLECGDVIAALPEPIAVVGDTRRCGACPRRGPLKVTKVEVSHG